jgi:hypothetical protein
MILLLLTLCFIQHKTYLTPYEVATYRYERLNCYLRNRTFHPEYLKLDTHLGYKGDKISVVLYTNFSQDNLQFNCIFDPETEANIWEVVQMFFQIEYGQCDIELSGFD